MPGPVCYGRGGTEPTVTDANLILGRLDPEHFLGGEMLLDLPAAERRPARASLPPEVPASGIEAVYPLSPMQEGMLYHTLRDLSGAAYVGQFGFVGLGAFRKAPGQIDDLRPRPDQRLDGCVRRIPGFDHDGPARGHGVPRVDRQVHQELLDLPAVALDRRELVGGDDDQRHLTLATGLALGAYA